MVIIKIYEDCTKSTQGDLHNYKELYIEKYGEHFNEALCEFAVSKMSKYNESIRPIEKDIVDTLLEAYNITLNHNTLWDYVYVANMGKADFYGSSITDELHLANYIKDVIDDDDSYDGMLFSRWCSDMCKKNVNIDWESFI